jgi:hypothetical protein
VSASVIERQALSNLIRVSRSRDPIMKYDSLSTLMSPVDVGASLAGLEHCPDVPLFPTVSCWPRPENRLTRLLSWVGMSRLMEWFLLFLATMASSHAEDRRLAKDGGEVRIQVVYAYYLRCERDRSCNWPSKILENLRYYLGMDGPPTNQKSLRLWIITAALLALAAWTYFRG